jgi:hypothetical protein
MGELHPLFDYVRRCLEEIVGYCCGRSDEHRGVNAIIIVFEPQEFLHEFVKAKLSGMSWYATNCGYTRAFPKTEKTLFLIKYLCCLNGIGFRTHGLQVSLIIETR